MHRELERAVAQESIQQLRHRDRYRPCHERDAPCPHDLAGTLWKNATQMPMASAYNSPRCRQPARPRCRRPLRCPPRRSQSHPRWRPWGRGSCPPRSSPAAAAWEQARHLRLTPLAHPSPLRCWRARAGGMQEGETVGVRRAESKPDAEDDDLCPQQQPTFRVGSSHSPTEVHSRSWTGRWRGPAAAPAPPATCPSAAPPRYSSSRPPAGRRTLSSTGRGS